ncbi:MAG: aa3-type cytochrome c oxidase subunit IV [Inquilinus sp.]|nr:aa3-type cytochrome c oxidase subunit IV [Inquilinus sp.]
MATTSHGPVDPEFLGEKQATYTAFLKRSFYAVLLMVVVLVGMALFLL